MVYVARNSATAVRSIANEADLISGLQRHFGDLLVVHRGTESLTEQLMMFAQGSVIIGAHGAGLANLMVARQGSCVVMFPMQPLSDHTFIHMAAALDLEMTIMTDISSYYYGNYGLVDSAKIQAVVETADKCWTARHGPLSLEKDEL